MTSPLPAAFPTASVMLRNGRLEEPVPFGPASSSTYKSILRPASEGAGGGSGGGGFGRELLTTWTASFCRFRRVRINGPEPFGPLVVWASVRITTSWLCERQKPAKAVVESPFDLLVINPPTLAPPWNPPPGRSTN